jgi:hypothetical protein
MDKLANYRWSVIVRAAVKWSSRWQDRDVEVRRRYSHLLAKLLHFYKTGDRMLIYID